MIFANMTQHQADVASVVDDYCQTHFARSVRPHLEIDDLPWDQLPSVDHLRVTAGVHVRVTDGYLISDDMVRETQTALQTFVEYCQRKRIRLETRHGLSVREVLRMPKICIILNIIGNRQLLLPLLLAEEIYDDSLPLDRERVQRVFAAVSAEALVESFYSEQFRIWHRRWDDAEHIELGRREPLPFRHVAFLGNGNQGTIDEVELVTCGHHMARKLWTNVSKRAKDRFFQEVALIKRLSHLNHIIELFGTYERGMELGMLHRPVANCDLSFVLGLSPTEREPIIQDSELGHAFGCLTMALAYLHSSGVRHKDIKPQNILIHDGRLLLTDFGISKDIRDLSNSITSGGQGTQSYIAPELADREMEARQAPADIFALGCVLMEIWSVLQGWGSNSELSFSRFSPFHQKLRLIQTWIHGMDHSWSGECSLTCPFNAAMLPPTAYISEMVSISPDLEDRYYDERDHTWLRTCSLMLQPNPEIRPTASKIIQGFEEVTIELFCCYSCQTALRTSDVGDSPISEQGSTESGHSVNITNSSLTVPDYGTNLTANIGRYLEEMVPYGQRETPYNDRFQDLQYNPFGSPGLQYNPFSQNWEGQSPRGAQVRSPFVDSEEIAPRARTDEREQSTTRNLPLINPPETSNVIYFEDCLHRKFELPYESWRSWESMDRFIRENFPHKGYSNMRISIVRGEYDLVGPNGHVIPRGRLWSQTIKSGWEVKLNLWPEEVAELSQPRRLEPQMSGALPVRPSPPPPLLLTPEPAATAAPGSVPAPIAASLSAPATSTSSVRIPAPAPELASAPSVTDTTSPQISAPMPEPEAVPQGIEEPRRDPVQLPQHELLRELAREPVPAHVPTSAVESNNVQTHADRQLREATNPPIQPSTMPARTPTSSSRTESKKKDKKPVSRSSLLWIAGRASTSSKSGRK